MPMLDTPKYDCPRWLRGAHLETVAPNLTRRRLPAAYRRERLELSDGDFVDLDLLSGTSSENVGTCVLALHGLEGSSDAPYMKSLGRSVRGRGWDFAALNFRGCSGELNRLPRFYHSGETGDVAAALHWLEGRYERLFLVGFSLGGNVALKYLGEAPDAVAGTLAAAAAISAPVDLEGSARRISQRENAFYMRRFIRLLSAKIEAKAQVYPDILNAQGCRGMRDFEAFDGRYTAPLNGFASAQDYWRRCSATNWLASIRRPALLLNARNDPFLSAGCFPEAAARESAYLYSLFPDRGGHLGFPGWRRDGQAWHEAAALDFLAARAGVD